MAVTDEELEQKAMDAYRAEQIEKEDIDKYKEYLKQKYNGYERLPEKPAYPLGNK